jgi:hypothetical protein
MRSALTWQPAQLRSARFAGLADLIARVVAAEDWPSCAQLNDWFVDEFAVANVRMVTADKMRAALGADGCLDPLSLYEVRISDTGDVPTRARNLHDLLNALMWAAFPYSKRALTQRLAAMQRVRAAGQSKLPVARTRPHDRLALVDEGGVITPRGEAGAWIFGHAILEHAYAGIMDVRGAVIQLDIEPSQLAVEPHEARRVVDAALARVVADDALMAAAMVAGAGQFIDDACLASCAL